MLIVQFAQGYAYVLLILFVLTSFAGALNAFRKFSGPPLYPYTVLADAPTNNGMLRRPRYYKLNAS